MRPALTILALLLFATASFAQANYTNFVGGRLSFSASETNLELGVQPYVGHFLRPKLAVVGSVGYDFARFTPRVSNQFRQTYQTLSASLGLRTYIGPEAAALRFFLSPQFNYQFAFDRVLNPNLLNGDDRSSGTRSVGVSVAPAVSYTFRRFNILAFFGSAFFAHYPAREGNDFGSVGTSDNVIGLALGSGLNLAAEYRF